VAHVLDKPSREGFHNYDVNTYTIIFTKTYFFYTFIKN